MTGVLALILRSRPVALLRRVRDDREGVTAVEFAMAAPVLFIMLMGIFDIGHMTYVSAVLNGAVQRVARNSTLEGTNITTEDAYVTSVVQSSAPGAQVTFARKSYYDFNNIAQPEPWNDANNNSRCDNSEAYTDENRNGQWDADVGKAGNGGANDVVVYTVTATYTPLFPIPGLTNRSGSRTLSSSAVKKNQPFSQQNGVGSTAGTCT